MAKRTEKIRLSHAEKQQLKALMARREQQDRKGPRTAQATIPYQRMWPDGICRVTDQYYTKTLRFQDINYQLAQNDDKTAIFEGWCDFLNYFDNSIHLQFSFLNLTASKEVFEQSILIPDREDGNDEIRHEYADMLQTQQAKGNNGLTKTKFITFGIEAEGIKAAKPRLERIEIDLLNNFKRLGVAASPLDGRERLKLMHDMFHMDTQAPFLFDWKWLAPSGLSTKDFIAPSSFDFRDKRTFGMGKKQAEVSFFSILASDLNDRCLADFQQENGMVSCLPLGHNLVRIQRGLTTSSTAIFVPFTSQELFQTGGEALYCGLNALSHNLIMVDRKKLKNPNGLILGTPGSGKSFAAKREICNVILLTDDDIIICDPEGEYFPLVNTFRGQVIRISPTSSSYINPMDINLNYSEEENPLSLKSDFILSLCELIVGGRDGLQPIEKTLIDRAVHIIYQPYLNDPRPENIPILEDLYNALRAQEEKEAQRLATALEIYVTGSLNVFNHRTNVDVNNRLVCYDIKELGKQLKKLGMLIVQDQVWGRVTANRAEGKSTRYYMDEFHLLLKEEQTAAYSVEIWKRFRKWGGIPTGITQNVKDLLASQEIENIFENSDYIYMLNQAAGDREILARKLGISPHQLSYVTQSGEGEGLLFYGNVILPFQDRFPKNTRLYSIMTTKPSDLLDHAAYEKISGLPRA